jgi:hypothetical protein
VDRLRCARHGSASRGSAHACGSCRRKADEGKADVVLGNGKVYTADPARSIGEAIAFISGANAALLEGPIEPYLGPERYRYMYPAGSLYRAGATLIGGSDWDISTYNPFVAFQVGVTRAGGPGQKPLNLDERIPLTTAIDAYTINAAYAMKQDAITGSLEVGKRADLIVLDRDILAADPDTISATKVLATYFDGRLIYSAPGDAGGQHPEELRRD